MNRATRIKALFGTRPAPFQILFPDGETPRQAETKHAQLRSALLRVFLAFALLNLPFWILARTDFMNRPWLDLDLAIPIALGFFSVIAGLLLLVLLWALDLAVSQSLAWNFHNPYEFIRSIEFVPSVHLASYASNALAMRILAFAICGGCAFWLTRRLRRVPYAALLLIVVVGLADVANGSSILWTRASRLVQANVAGSSIKTSVTAMQRSDGAVPRPIVGKVSLTSRFDVLEFAKAHPDRSILLVLVESMGIHRDPALRDALRARLVGGDVASRFDVRDYAIAFKGSTVNGELRELCSMEGNYRLLHEVRNARCLPRELDDLGWTTTGLHGFSHRMFMRSEWWPHTGLQRGLFAEDLVDTEQGRCGGAFAGICDAALIRRAVIETRGPRHFVYALTVNSHLPLEAVHSDPATQRLCDRASVDADVCAMLSTIGVTFDALRTALMSEADPPLVLVVGDHAPPFAVSTSRDQFSQSTVPGMVLIPK